MKIYGSLARNIDFEVALHTLHSYTPHSSLDTRTLYDSTLHTLHCGFALYGESCTFPCRHSKHFTLRTFGTHSTLYNSSLLHSTLCHSKMSCTLRYRSTLHHSIHSTLHSTLHTPHFTFHTPHSTLYTLHFTLYTPHSTLHT